MDDSTLHSLYHISRCGWVVSALEFFSSICAETWSCLFRFPEVVDGEEAEEGEEEEEGVLNVPVMAKVPNLSHRKQSRHDAVAALSMIPV